MGVAILLQGGKIQKHTPTISSFLTPTCSAGLELIQGQEVLALIIQFLLLLITNKIIKFLGNECSHWPLCFRSGILIRPASLFSHDPGPAIFPPTLRAEAENWDGWNHSWGSYCQGREKMLCRGRGPFSHHTLLPFTREGGKGEVTGQEDRKHVQKEYTRP